MALSIPRVGFNRLLKDGAKHFRGVEESAMRNIEACTEFTNSVKSAYGPNGMNKMVINHLEKLFVTNDAATIVRELEVQHPAVKMLIMAMQMQEQEVGDGTNMVLILAGSLLQHAEQLIRMGLKPTEIADGYEAASLKALEILPTLTVDKVSDLTKLEEATKALKSCIMSKQFGNEDFLSKLAAEACIQILPQNAASFNVDNVRICKILGAGLSSSRVVNGMVFRRGTETDLKSMDNAKIAVYTTAFDLLQTETKGTVLIKSAAELLDYSKGEENIVEQQVKSLVDAGVNCVVAGGKFGDLYVHFLNKYGLLGIRLNSKFDIRRLCRSIGATALPTVTVPTKDEIGHCDHVFVDEMGETNVVIFRQDGEHSRVSTVIVRGSTQNLMDDIERALDDAINTYKALTRDNTLLPGAGAVEIELAKQIEQYGSVCPGLEQYAIEKFAQALETLPKILADNAGCKSTEILSKLYAAHQEGKQNFGFDNEVEHGGVKDAVAAGILDPYLSKYWAIKLATNAASTVLRVDQIIMSKPAGDGGIKPKGPKVQDEDD